MAVRKHPVIGKWRRVFKGIHYDFFQAPVLLPDGRRTIYERVDRRDTVMLLPIDDRGRLLLVREYFEELEQYHWNLPAGKCDRGERPQITAQRELREELGLRAKKLTLIHRGKALRAMTWNRYHFLATGLTRDPLPTSEFEDITVFPTPLKKAFKMVLDGTIHQEVTGYLITRLYFNRKKWLPQFFK